MEGNRQERSPPGCLCAYGRCVTIVDKCPRVSVRPVGVLSVGGTQAAAFGTNAVPVDVEDVTIIGRDVDDAVAGRRDADATVR